MKRLFITGFLLVTALMLSSQKSYAIGGFVTNGLPQIAPVETRMIVILDGTKETIISTNTFAVNPLIIDNFVWVIPFPSKPQISVLKDDAFIQMDKLTQNKFNKKSLWKKIIYFDIAEEPNSPPQTFSYPAYIKNPKTFSSEDHGQALQKWLYRLGDSIPKNSRELYKSYLQKKWYFAGLEVDAVHMEFDATDSLRMSGAHVIPVAFTFQTNKPIIPLKFTSLQSDRDSVAAPLSFPYGSSSEAVLGAKDERFDDLLSTPSGNRYPPLPLDLVNLKIELFIFDTQKTSIKGFTTIYADTVDGNKFSLKNPLGKYYWHLPAKKMYLTHLYAYKPISQLEDYTIEKTQSNTRVNPSISIFETFLRIIIFGFLLWLVFKLIGRSYK